MVSTLLSNVSASERRALSHSHSLTLCAATETGAKCDSISNSKTKIEGGQSCHPSIHPSYASPRERRESRRACKWQRRKLMPDEAATAARLVMLRRGRTAHSASAPLPSRPERYRCLDWRFECVERGHRVYALLQSPGQGERASKRAKLDSSMQVLPVPSAHAPRAGRSRGPVFSTASPVWNSVRRCASSA